MSNLTTFNAAKTDELRKGMICALELKYVFARKPLKKEMNNCRLNSHKVQGRLSTHTYLIRVTNMQL